MKKEYKAHPFMILTFFKRYIFVLLIPLLNMISDVIANRRTKGGFFAEIVVFCLLSAVAYLRYRNFRIVADDEKLTVYKGFLFRQKAQIPLAAVSCISIRQVFFEKPFGSAFVTLSTEAAGGKQGDFEFRMRQTDAAELLIRVFGEEKRTAVSFGVKRLALFALLSSSAVTGLIIGVPFIDRLGKLLGTALSKTLFNEINAVSNRFNTYFPPVFNAVTLILLVGFAFSFLNSFINAVKLKLFTGERILEVHSGLFTHRQTVFAKDAVRDAVIDQTFLMYLFRRYMICVNIAGYDAKRGEFSVIIPCVRRSELSGAEILKLPHLKQNGLILRPLRNRRNLFRFIKVPLILFSVLSGAVLAVSLIVPFFERFLLLASLPLLLMIVYLGFYFYYNYSFSRLSLGETVYVRAARGVSLREMYLPKENIAAIKITRGIVARKKGSCTVKLAVFAKKTDKIRIWHLDYRSVKENLSVLLKNNR